MGRGWDSAPMASLKPATGEPAAVTVRVCVLPGERLGRMIALSVPEGATWPCV